MQEKVNIEENTNSTTVLESNEKEQVLAATGPAQESLSDDKIAPQLEQESTQEQVLEGTEPIQMSPKITSQTEQEPIEEKPTLLSMAEEIQRLKDTLREKELYDFAVKKAVELSLSIDCIPLLNGKDEKTIDAQALALEELITKEAQKRVEDRIRGSQHVPFSNIGVKATMPPKQRTLGDIFNDRK